MLTDFYEYEPKEKFDAIVIMGVIEHLPDYERVLKKVRPRFKPGGRVFLDGSAGEEEIRALHLHGAAHLSRQPLLPRARRSPQQACKKDRASSLMEVQNDRWSYFLTFQQWARNLEASRDYVTRTFGDFEFRKFRLYLWGAAYEFLNRNLDCYRLILHKPIDAS